MNTPTIIVEPENDGIILRVGRDGFANFVKNLLGQPQTIENRYLGAFDIGRIEILQLYHLVDQRVKQQNISTLIQFSIKINYEDDSSVLLNSFADFDSYVEVKDLISTGATLTWSYLIAFPDRPQPERQSIEVSVKSTMPEFDVSLPFFLNIGPLTGVRIRIEHTARTWGADVENMISHHVKSWFIKEHWCKRFIYENPGWIAVISGSVLMAIASVGLLLTAHNLETTARIALENALKLASDEKLNYLVQATFDAKFLGGMRYFTAFYGLCAAICLVAGIGIGRLSENRPKSFLTISAAAQKSKAAAMAKRRKGWTYFICSGITALIASLASKYLFLYIATNY